MDQRRGEPEDKLHLHWRLRTPATGADLVKLKGEATGRRPGRWRRFQLPAIHCLRWPGSWHRKKEPRLCELIACNPDIESDLDEALAALQAAAPVRNGQSGGSADDAALIANIRNGLNLHDSITDWRPGTSPGSTINDAIARLQAYMNDSRARLERTKDWQTRYDDIARSVESAYLKFRRGEPEPGLRPRAATLETNGVGPHATDNPHRRRPTAGRGRREREGRYGMRTFRSSRAAPRSCFQASPNCRRAMGAQSKAQCCVSLLLIGCFAGSPKRRRSSGTTRAPRNG